MLRLANRLTDCCSPLRNGDANSPHVAECRQLAPFATGLLYGGRNGRYGVARSAMSGVKINRALQI